MDRSSVAYLIGTINEKDEDGVYHGKEYSRVVYCNVSSVNANEWFEGGRNGLVPQYRVIMLKSDYKGEKVLMYRHIRYTIYRTYEGRNDMIELYVEKKKGNE